MNSKLLSAAIAACLLTGSIITPWTAAANELLYGDVNQDTSVDVSDAVLVARFAAEDRTAQISGSGMICADVNADGTVDTKDAADILKYIAKLLGHPLGTGTQHESSESTYNAVNLTEHAATVAVESKKCDEDFLASQYNLSANLLKKAGDFSRDQNMMISPLSIAEALAMTANGAKGITQEEMAKVLGGDIPMNDLNAYYYDYMQSLKNTDSAMLKQANSVWIRDDEDMIDVPEAFLRIVKNNYAAQVFRAPFDETTVYDVNMWVDKQTDGMIPTLLEYIDNSTIMYLINALTFDAKWAHPYKPLHDVSDGEFTKADGEVCSVRMMAGVEGDYLEDGKATGFVKYYEDLNYSFAAILPNEDITLNEYISSLDGEALKNLLNSRSSHVVYTWLPKFSFDYSISLKESLQLMGMPTAFDKGKADFSGLNTMNPSYIDDVLHKTHISVDEEGTRAAAVTAVGVGGCAVTDIKLVCLDRPFLFMILDENTKLPIFIGTVNDPA